MPLIPAIRPANSISNAADRPIIAPPISADTGVKLAMTNPFPSLQAGGGDNMPTQCEPDKQRRNGADWRRGEALRSNVKRAK
jgi:hypothetical protein